jgi:hypothetical protein
MRRKFESERQRKLTRTGHKIFISSYNQLQNDFSLLTQQKIQGENTVTRVRFGLCLLVQQTNV